MLERSKGFDGWSGTFRHPNDGLHACTLQPGLSSLPWLPGCADVTAGWLIPAILPALSASRGLRVPRCVRRCLPACLFYLAVFSLFFLENLLFEINQKQLFKAARVPSQKKLRL